MNTLSASHTKVYLVYVILEYKGTRPVQALQPRWLYALVIRLRITLSLNGPAFPFLSRSFDEREKERNGELYAACVKLMDALSSEKRRRASRINARRAVASKDNVAFPFDDA